MDVLRTPDERFAGLVGFPFPPQYVEIDAGDGTATRLRAHVVDTGPPAATERVVLLHGEPSWSYLYRAMIPPLVDAGNRVVAPDLIGFGRSDKPARRDDYTYQRHVDWLGAVLFDELGLDGITLFCQDWGGLLGLRLVAEHPGRFRRVIAANTFLPTGDDPPGEAFLDWRRVSQELPEFPAGAIVASASLADLPAEVVAAYDAPFPDESYRQGARQFPLLVPVGPDDPASGPNRRAWAALERFDRPFLCAFSDGDAVTSALDRELIERIPGAAGEPHARVRGGHFLQEDAGPELARIVLDHIARHP